MHLRLYQSMSREEIFTLLALDFRMHSSRLQLRNVLCLVITAISNGLDVRRVKN